MTMEDVPGWSCNQYSHHLSVVPSVSIIYAFLCRLFLCQPSFCPPCFLLRHELTRPTHLFCNFLPHSVRQGCLLLATLTVLFPSPARHLFDNNDICLPCNEKAHFGQNMCLRHWKYSVFVSSIIPHQLSGSVSSCVDLIQQTRVLLFFSHVASFWDRFPE